jgi:hypothetical protein
MAGFASADPSEPGVRMADFELVAPSGPAVGMAGFGAAASRYLRTVPQSMPSCAGDPPS